MNNNKGNKAIFKETALLLNFDREKTEHFHARFKIFYFILNEYTLPASMLSGLLVNPNKSLTVTT